MTEPDSSGSARAIDFAADLNPAQRAAVAALDGPHLIVAGAGSGKTRTLVYRVANLVARGVAPESILLLTFTRRAAHEMLRRAEAILDERCRRVAGGTFHSFANLVLRRYGQKLGYEGGFTILDRADAADLVGLLRTEGGYDRQGRRFPRKDTILDLFSKQVNTHRPLADLLAEDYPQFLDDLDALSELARAYEARKREHNVMDYDDLLVNLRDLLVHHEEVRGKLAALYRFVMVDEYQDTNRLQAHIAALLAAGHGNLMVVGDDAQSIYSFRGADFRNIMDFPKVFPGCQISVLEQNYRSTQPILDLANAILEGAREKYAKSLFTEIPGASRPLLVRTADDEGQARFVAERVLELREEGVPLRDIAVLCRAAWHSNTLELELRRRNLPFRKFGGIKFVEAAHVKDVCALLRLSANPRDAGAWFRILQFYDGIGPRTAQAIGQQVIAQGGDLAVLVAPELARRKFGPDLAALRQLLGRLAAPGLGLAERVDQAVAAYRELMPAKYDDAQRRSRDLEALLALAGRYPTVEEFLTDLAIEPPEVARPGARDDREDEWLTVSTVHSAKGLEWHTVFLIHLNSGQFPAYRSLVDPDPAVLEEERRLFYVGVTRAQQNLYLLKPETLPRRGAWGGEIAEMTPFLAELSRLGELVEAVVYAPETAEEGWREGEAAAGDGALLARIQDYFGS